MHLRHENFNTHPRVARASIAGWLSLHLVHCTMSLPLPRTQLFSGFHQPPSPVLESSINWRLIMPSLSLSLSLSLSDCLSLSFSAIIVSIQVMEYNILIKLINLMSTHAVITLKDPSCLEGCIKNKLCFFLSGSKLIYGAIGIRCFTFYHLDALACQVCVYVWEHYLLNTNSRLSPPHTHFSGIPTLIKCTLTLLGYARTPLFPSLFPIPSLTFSFIFIR